MKPPVCSICYKNFEDLKEGGLIYFTKRPEDEEWRKKMKEGRMTGHPPYAAWFCGEHYEEARKLENLTIDEAMKILRELFKAK
ncbi:MAG: hypothetical protein KIH10_10650 [Candidatus Freyarchaeota archaeon]|nr:hypothetical protein [Candidatus Jordarchaeia archaeon]MBS7280784.1 hypothetical protein [Candidatus Jordarchaeia archaeon]